MGMGLSHEPKEFVRVPKALRSISLDNKTKVDD